MRLGVMLAAYKLYGLVKKAIKIREKKGVKAMLDWIKARLGEPSTIKAIVTVLAAVGIGVGEGVVQAACALALSALAFYEMIRSEKE